METEDPKRQEKSNQVFISYSWDDEPHKQWVLDLTNRLRDNGIDAIIDRTHLELGGDTPEFMEKSIRESRSVLVVCTDKYKDRFNGRRGGAGYEGIQSIVALPADRGFSQNLRGFGAVRRAMPVRIALEPAC